MKVDGYPGQCLHLLKYAGFRHIVCVGTWPGTYKMAKDDDTLYLSVEMGEGVTISSNVTKLFQNPAIDSIPLHLRSYLSVCWNPKNENPYVQKLVQMIRQIKLAQQS